MPEIKGGVGRFYIDDKPLITNEWKLVIDEGLDPAIAVVSIATDVIEIEAKLSNWTDEFAGSFATINDFYSYVDSFFIQLQTGEINTTSNKGGGFEIALPKDSLDFPFRTLTEGTGITITQNAETLEISNSGGFFRENVLYGASTAVSQEPTLTDSPLQVEFGAAQFTPSDPVSLSATGTVTINQPDNYYFVLTAHYGRTGGAGTSIIHARVLINGVQQSHTLTAKLDSSNVSIPIEVEFILPPVPAGTLLTVEVMRDSAGNNSGGFFQTIPTLAGWNNAPSAVISVSRLRVT